MAPPTFGHLAGASITRLIERAVTVSDLLSEPLAVVPTSLAPDEVRATLRARAFDLIGVDTTGDGSADSWIGLDDLSSDTPIRRSAKPLLANMAVERSMSLVRLLDLMRGKQHVFVLDGDTVGFILTRADLARPPVGLVTLTYLLALEQAVIALSVPRLGSRWFDCLPSATLSRATELYCRNVGHRAELGLEDCLFFDDAMALATSAPGLVRELGATSGRFNTLRGEMASLRNNLAHGGTILDRASPVAALETFASIRRLTERAEGVLLGPPNEGTQSLSCRVNVDTADGTKLAGPNAVESLPFSGPAFVLTAWNPGGRTRPDHDNRSAQAELMKLFPERVEVIEASEMSLDGQWIEPGCVVTGMDATTAIGLAEQFGQQGVAELTDEQARVLSVPDGTVISKGARRWG